jgi:bifunctional non-homologous end joining protein LigD
VPVTYVAFDILRRYGVDLTARAYVERRASLDRWAEQHPGWTISPFFDDGPATEAAARSNGLEGVVAKRLASTYRPGGRGPDWQKLRFLQTGDFVIIGWEASDERPGVLSSLLLGVATESGFEFAGKAGSGLTVPLAKSLQSKLVAEPAPVVEPRSVVEPGEERARAETTSFKTVGRSAVWVRPEIVVEVAYSGITEDRRLRQPVFLRVRDDKTASEATG